MGRERARKSGLKPLEWVGSSRADLVEFPRDVRKAVGYSLHLAQAGEKPPVAKPLRGFGGAGVLELIENCLGDACRVVYTVRFEKAVFVLHAFQKKSTKGISTPKPDVNLIKRRLAAAEHLYQTKVLRTTAMKEEIDIQRGSGNVFADLDIPEAEEYFAKSKLAVQIFKVIHRRRLTQAAAGKVLGISQPKVSALLNGQLDGFSTDRLFRYLTALGCDVRIAVSAPRPRARGTIRVKAG
jgi:phage-related protein/predicted XRE-type DNA-binding protein